MIGIILYIIASITAPFVNLLGLIIGVIIVLSSKEFKGERLKVLGGDLKNNALSKDQHANVANKRWFNIIFIKRNCRQEGKFCPFGDPDQTISYVIGKNLEMNALNSFGYFWAHFLNTVDENHVEKAVELEESE